MRLLRPLHAVAPGGGHEARPSIDVLLGLFSANEIFKCSSGGFISVPWPAIVSGPRLMALAKDINVDPPHGTASATESCDLTTGHYPKHRQHPRGDDSEATVPDPPPHARAVHTHTVAPPDKKFSPVTPLSSLCTFCVVAFFCSSSGVFCVFARPSTVLPNPPRSQRLVVPETFHTHTASPPVSINIPPLLSSSRGQQNDRALPTIPCYTAMHATAHLCWCHPSRKIALPIPQARSRSHHPRTHSPVSCFLVPPRFFCFFAVGSPSAENPRRGCVRRRSNNSFRLFARRADAPSSRSCVSGANVAGALACIALFNRVAVAAAAVGNSCAASAYDVCLVCARHSKQSTWALPNCVHPPSRHTVNNATRPEHSPHKHPTPPRRCLA